jgi:AcrR family transcriptional regulator
VTTTTRAPATARAVARRELTRAILDEARRQLAEVGPAVLSVRAVARELGMASSAVYRYFATRDELITALLVLSYDDLGSAAEQADAAVRQRRQHRARWLSVTRAVRAWARQHPHDYALLYGSPVPGYAAPQDTVNPATRVIRVVLRIVADAAAEKAHEDQQRGEQMREEHEPRAMPRAIPRSARRAVASARAFAGPEFDDESVYRALTAWSGLIGTVTLELFGHLHNAVDDYDAWFDHTMLRLSPL